MVPQTTTLPIELLPKLYLILNYITDLQLKGLEPLKLRSLVWYVYQFRHSCNFYYFLIFIEVLRQIFQKAETNISVVFGSISGYLLLVVMAQFTYLLIEYNIPNSFSGIEVGSIPKIYNQLSYFSMVTLSTVGFGDIAPLTDTARLSTMFFTVQK